MCLQIIDVFGAQRNLPGRVDVLGQEMPLRDLVLHYVEAGLLMQLPYATFRRKV